MADRWDERNRDGKYQHNSYRPPAKITEYGVRGTDTNVVQKKIGNSPVKHIALMVSKLKGGGVESFTVRFKEEFDKAGYNTKIVFDVFGDNEAEEETPHIVLKNAQLDWQDGYWLKRNVELRRKQLKALIDEYGFDTFVSANFAGFQHNRSAPPAKFASPRRA